MTGIVYCGVILACQEVYEVASRARMDEGALGLVGRCSRRWSRSPVAASSIGPKSCSSTARGPRRWSRLAARESAFSRRRTLRRVSLATARVSSSGYKASSAPRRRRTSRRARSAGSRSPGLAQLATRAGAPRARPRSAIRRAEVGRHAAARPSAPASGLRRDHARRGGHRGSARRACDELEELAGGYESGMLEAIVALCPGLCSARGGDVPAALAVALGRAADLWQALEAPYEIARTRRARRRSLPRCSATKRRPALELEAARGIFEHLGAKPDLGRLRLEAGRCPRALAHASWRCSVSSRRGSSNREIASRARDQRAHRRSASPEHLREARSLFPDRGDCVRLRARPRLTLSRAAEPSDGQN